ncbi:MAG: hypothetical protein QOJ99_2245 [Bryobacterales bacterium]|jgi:hypothetical protein|nr:hypothetical protein [Bryobacterales bacterium]
MSHGSATKKAEFTVIDQMSVNAAWNGSPVTLNPGQNVNLPQTTNGSMVLVYQNMATQNNNGQLSLTSGGAQPTFLPVPALANQPSVDINNWQGNNLSITNISVPGSATPIWVAAVGPGIPGVVSSALPMDGSAISLSTGQSAQGNALPRYMQLNLQSNAGTLTIFAVIGGPANNSGQNAYMVAVNATSNTGPGTGVNPPAGYYATTTSNVYSYVFNWGSSAVFVANESPSTAAAASISVRPL